jgi:L-rhamnose-H+ transport protein
MNTDTQLGALIVVLGGLLHGSFAFPMKRLEQRWRWENTWLVYAVVSMIAFPIFLAWSTVPRLGEVYSGVSIGRILVVALFGFGWGLGSTLFGLGISRVGMALAFALILGLTSSVGSLLPLLVTNPGEIATRRGAILGMGLLLVIGGIVCCSIAGAWRERDQKGAAAVAAKAGAEYRTGLWICFASGILSPMLNIGFVYGQPIQDLAAKLGARADLATNAVWAPALAAGFLANGGYAVYLLNKNKTWNVYRTSGAPIWFWCAAAIMGLIWFGGIATYGVGSASMGPFGKIIGWPVFMAMVIITANVLGALQGEWARTTGRTRGLLWGGIGVLIVAIIVLAQA